MLSCSQNTPTDLGRLVPGPTKYVLPDRLECALALRKPSSAQKICDRRRSPEPIQWNSLIPGTVQGTYERQKMPLTPGGAQISLDKLGSVLYYIGRRPYLTRSEPLFFVGQDAAIRKYRELTATVPIHATSRRTDYAQASITQVGAGGMANFHTPKRSRPYSGAISDYTHLS